MWLAILLSILSGFMLTAGFPRLNLPLISWVALLPLLYALRAKSGRDALLLGFVCGMAHYLTTLYWIRFVVYNYGGLPLPVAVLVLVLLCAYLALYPAAFAFLAQRWETRPRLWLWGLPTVWVGLEWVRANALSGFPWANMGYTQTHFLSLIQVADITGVYGISWLVVFANVCIMSYVKIMGGLRPAVRATQPATAPGEWRRDLSARFAVAWQCHAAALFLVVCIVGALLYGRWRIATVERMQSEAAPFTVAGVQGNIEQSIKWDPAFQDYTLNRYRELSVEAANSQPKPDLLAWPEASAPFLFGIDPVLTQRLESIVREVHTPLLFGSPAARRVEGRVQFLNMAYLLDGNVMLIGKYAKQHLVPFGEYVPLKKLLFFVHRLVEAAGDFASGDDPSPLSLNGHRLGVLICYEDIFPELARSTVNRGATILVNITNDAWYGTSSAPYQHLEMARWRTIECRVPMVRAANTGISAAFDAAGHRYGELALNTRGALVSTLHPIRLKTFYAAWGDVFAWGCTLIALATVVFSARTVFSRSGT